MYILGDTVGDVSAVDEEGPRRFVLKNTKAVNMFTLLIGITLMYSTPFVFGALGGVISERSEVMNIGIDGMMTVGAFIGAMTGYYTGSPLAGIVSAALVGGVIAALHAVAAITFKPDRTISGCAVNLLGPGLARQGCGLCSITGIAKVKNTHEEVVRIANESSEKLYSWVKNIIEDWH